jgi:putative transposase
MPRKPRELIDNGVYHLISRGNNHLAILAVDGGYAQFRELMRRTLVSYPSLKIYHYCLMPNHVHILAEIGMAAELPKIMKGLLQNYSNWYRQQTNYLGHVWQARYRSPRIAKDSYLLECARYIERNPVKAGLVTKLEDYPWSSYRHYAYNMPDPLVTTNPFYMDFGSPGLQRVVNYRRYTQL